MVCFLGIDAAHRVFRTCPSSQGAFSSPLLGQPCDDERHRAEGGGKVGGVGVLGGFIFQMNQPTFFEKKRPAPSPQRRCVYLRSTRNLFLLDFCISAHLLPKQGAQRLPRRRGPSI